MEKTTQTVFRFTMEDIEKLLVDYLVHTRQFTEQTRDCGEYWLQLSSDIALERDDDGTLITPDYGDNVIELAITISTE